MTKCGRAFKAKGRVCAKIKRVERASCVLGTRSRLALLKRGMLRGENSLRERQIPGDPRQQPSVINRDEFQAA